MVLPKFDLVFIFFLVMIINLHSSQVLVFEMVLRILLLKRKGVCPLHRARIPLLVKQANKLGIPQTVPRGVSMESIKNHMKCGEKKRWCETAK